MIEKESNSHYFNGKRLDTDISWFIFLHALIIREVPKKEEEKKEEGEGEPSAKKAKKESMETVTVKRVHHVYDKSCACMTLFYVASIKLHN